MKITFPLCCLSFLLGLTACTSDKNEINQSLDYCVEQVDRTLAEIPDVSQSPRNMEADEDHWNFTGVFDWTGGFWPGILWYVYEYTGEESRREIADKYTMPLAPLAFRKAVNHDLGFQIFCSFGNAYRLTGDEKYKQVILAAADTLATLYNPVTETILSWPGQEKRWAHNTIIDNMMNLELLFWAAENGGSPQLKDIAISHARKTGNNHFREDYSTFHLIDYDTISGEKRAGYTHQGYADESLWARGQAWAVYGFVMCYRETRIPEFLDIAQKAYDRYKKRLPEDCIPYWDFDAPFTPQEPRDASAASVMASALIEMSQYIADTELKKEYLEDAEKTLKSLASSEYRSGAVKPSFLLHSTGHKPKGSEVDASIIYADYYYIEALIRLKRMREN